MDSAVSGAVLTSPSRSFTYPALIALTAVPSGSLISLVLLQSVFGAITATLLFALLRDVFSVAPGRALGFALLFCVLPLQLFYERYVMAESATLLALAAMVYALGLYLKSGRLAAWIMVQVLGVILISFRMVYLPLVLALLVCVPPYRHVMRHRPPSWRKLGIHLAVGVAVTVVLHGGYRELTGALTGRSPAYQYENGHFLAAAWAPLIRADDVPGDDLWEVVRAVPDLRDPAMRPCQRWCADGLVGSIDRALLSEGSETVIRAIAMNVLTRDPFGVLQLGWHTFLEYFDRTRIRHVLSVDRGEHGYVTPEFADLMATRFGADALALINTDTPVRAWQAMAWPWAMVLAAAPAGMLVAALVLGRREKSGMPLVLAGFAMAYMAIVAIAAVEPVVRYLHPLTWPAVAVVALVAEAAVRAGGERPKQRDPCSAAGQPT